MRNHRNFVRDKCDSDWKKSWKKAEVTTTNFVKSHYSTTISTRVNVVERAILATRQPTTTKASCIGSGSRIMYSRNELLKLKNMKPYEMPKAILSLPISLISDFVVGLPTDNKSACSKSIILPDHNEYGGKSHMVSHHKTNNDSLTWERGRKLVANPNHHDNSYLPPHLRRRNTEAAAAEIVVFRKAINGILNKLTPESLESCISEITKLNANTKCCEEHLNVFAELVFHKAIITETYCETYAKLCLRFANMVINKSGSFRSVLLSYCHKHFAAGLENKIAEVKATWAEKIASEPNERMKAMYEESVEEHVKKEKDKFFGNIRFISELYLHINLPVNLIFSIINHLLKTSTDSVSLEAACKMLSVLGKNLETRDGKTLNKVFEIVANYSISKELDCRTRFKFKDLMDLKARDWKLRIIQQMTNVVPKTLSEIKSNC